MIVIEKWLFRTLLWTHRRTDQFFYRGGLAIFALKIFWQCPKTAMPTYKITLPDSPHPVMISKNPGFRALYVARRNEFQFFLFNKYKSISFFNFCCWLLPENNGFARVRGCPPAPWLVRLCMNCVSLCMCLCAVTGAVVNYALLVCLSVAAISAVSLITLVLYHCVTWCCCFTTSTCSSSPIQSST